MLPGHKTQLEYPADHARVTPMHPMRLDQSPVQSRHPVRTHSPVTFNDHGVLFVDLWPRVRRRVADLDLLTSTDCQQLAHFVRGRRVAAAASVVEVVAPVLQPTNEPLIELVQFHSPSC